MSGKKCVLEVTPAQLRTVNSALALLEAEVEIDDTNLHAVRLDLVERTRAVVHRCLAANRIEP